MHKIQSTKLITYGLIAAVAGLSPLSGCDFIEVAVETSKQQSANFVPDYQDQDLAGQINGEAWAYTVAQASERSDGSLLFTFYPATPDIPCGSVYQENKLIFSMMPELGETQLMWGEQTATFVEYRDGDSPMNHIVIQGTIDLEEISDEEVFGRLHIQAGEDTWANGNFVATICE